MTILMSAKNLIMLSNGAPFTERQWPVPEGLLYEQAFPLFVDILSTRCQGNHLFVVD